MNGPRSQLGSGLRRTGTPLVALVLAAAAGCVAQREMSRPNVLLISIDTLRADHLGAFGYERDTSPFLDSLARKGVRLERAFAPCSWTLPSHMSLLTSSYPHTHRVETIERVLPQSVPTLAALLRDAGYTTAAFVSWVYLSAEFGFGRGFDDYHELLPPPDQQGTAGHHVIRAGPFVDEVLGWARDRPQRPFFLFLHLFDPHMSYEPPLEIARRFDPGLDSVEHGYYEHLKQYIRGLHPTPVRVPPIERARAEALYDGEIRNVDNELKRLFAALSERGWLDNTVIVVSSDHGEEFDDHGSMEGHGWTLYDEVLHVPLIVVFPDGNHAGTTVDRVVETIDIAPTLLDIAGIEPPESFQGSSLLPLLSGEDGGDRAEQAFAQTQRFNVKWSLRTRQHKLVFTLDTKTNRFGVPVRPGFELYDLDGDPGEQRNIYDESSPLARDLVARLQAFAESKRELPTGRPRLSAEERERLRNLGYVGGTEPE